MKYMLDPLRGNIFPVFFYYSFLTVIGMIAVSSASAVDAAFLGNKVGEMALATVNLSLPFVILSGGIAYMMAIGASVNCGKYLGEGDPDTASSIFTKTLLATFVIAASISVIGRLGIDTLVTILGASPEIAPWVKKYLSMLLLFIPFLTCGICLSYFVRVDGRPLLAAASMVTGAGINISLDWLFVIKLNTGVQGAALATGLSQVALFSILLPHFLLKKGKLRFKKNGGSWKEILFAAYNGFSEFANEISAGILTFIFNWIMIKRMGISGVAAYTIVNYILYLGSMACYGIGDAIQPIISKNFGAEKSNRISSFLLVAWGTVFLIGIGIIALLVLVPDRMIDLFTNGEAGETTRIAKEFIAYFWPAFLLIGVNIVFSSYFTAMQKPLHSAVVAISRSLALPAIFLMVLPLCLGTKGIYMAIPFAEIGTFLMSLKLFAPNKPLQLVRIDRLYKRQELFIKKEISSSQYQ